MSTSPNITHPNPIVLPQLPLALNHNRLRLLEDIHHPRPFCLAVVPPHMHRPPLHATVPPPHQPLLARVELQLDLPLDHDPVVQADGPVHRALPSRPDVHEPQDGAAGDHDSRQVAEVGRVGGQVGGEVDGGLVGGVAEDELVAVLDHLGGRRLGQAGVEYGDARGIVGGYEALDFPQGRCLRLGGHGR